MVPCDLIKRRKICLRIQRVSLILSVCSADITSVLIFRYQILAPTAVAGGFVDGKKACEKLLDAIQLEKASYRVGSSKVINTIYKLAGKLEA